jgi:hypothetical protein
MMSGIFLAGFALMNGALTVFQVVIGVLYALPVAVVIVWLPRRS